MAQTSGNPVTAEFSSSGIPLYANIGFGGMQWALIGNDGDGVYSQNNTMTLLLAEGQSFGGDVPFDTTEPYLNQYSGSDLRNAMNSAFNAWQIDSREKTLVNRRSFVGGGSNMGTPDYDDDRISGPDCSNDTFWALSGHEMTMLPNGCRYFGTVTWWLRTPHYYDYLASYVSDYSYYGDHVNTGRHALRPGMQLDASSFFFATLIEGGKAGGASRNLSMYTPPTGLIKLTLKDNNKSGLNLSVSDKSPIAAAPGETFSIEYSDAVCGAGKYVSCVIVGTDNSVKCYGRLKDLGGTSVKSGTADITLPTGLPEGNYTLLMFNEELNGDYETDFASEPESIPLLADHGSYVISTTPANGGQDAAASGDFAVTFSQVMDTAVQGTITLTGGGSVKTAAAGSWSNNNKTYTAFYDGLAYNSEYTVRISGFQSGEGALMREDGRNTFTTGSRMTSIPLSSSVGFGGKIWDVIGNQGQGMLSGEGTMTLLLQNGQSLGGNIMFRNATQGSKYIDSDLKTAMDNIYVNLPVEKEKDMIKGRDLLGVSDITLTDQDKIYGDPVADAKFWPLSGDEVWQLPSALRIFGTSGWWLRSMTISNFYAACVNTDNLVTIGERLNKYHAVRPAVCLHTSGILFTTPAAGGKAGSPGSALSLTTRHAGAIKFTVKEPDTSKLNLAVANKSPVTARPGDSLSVAYSGAVTGENKYVSCMITDEANTETYYGKLLGLAGGSASPAGSAEIVLPADMQEGDYTLRLFNEEVNGDNVTDFASAPVNLSLTVDDQAPAFIPVTEITGLPTSMTAGTQLLFTGAVEPANATNRTIAFSVQDAGETGAAILDNTLSAVSEGTVTVRASVTNGLAEGVHYTQDFFIAVSPAPVISAVITPATLSFDKYSPTDVTAEVTWNSAAAITGIWDGSYSLAAPGDYEVSGNTLTIKPAYLETKSVGAVSLSIAFDRGDPAVLLIDVTDSTPPSIDPASAFYDLHAPGDVTTVITWNSASSVTSVTWDSVLVPGTDYTVSGSLLTVKKSCLAGLSLTAPDVLYFNILFDTGTAVCFTVNVMNSYIPSCDSSLMDLAVNGSTVAGFDPNLNTYSVALPFGTLPGSALTAVTAAANHPLAQAVISQAAALPGTATVTVTAEDGITQTAYTVSFTLEAKPGTAPVITADALPNGTVNTVYSQTLFAAGDTPILWTLDSGSLPGGLSLSADGVISGTPEAAGIFNFTVKASNVEGYDLKALHIIVSPAAPAGTAPVIVTESLPNGTVNTVYSQTLFAAGDAPILWTLDSGSLPGGLSLSDDGVISGTPSSAGSFSFTVKAISAAGENSKAMNIIIDPNVYTINAAAGSGGSISPIGPVSVATGGAQTFTISANVGYSIASVTVDGVDQGPISSYTFTGAMGDHAIYAAFAPAGGDDMAFGRLEEEASSFSISAEGFFKPNARMNIVPLAQNESAREELEALLNGKDVIAAFEISISPADGFLPPLTVSFKLGDQYNGRMVYVLHKLHDGSAEQFTAMVSGGAAIITVQELSPFLLAADPPAAITTQPQSITVAAGQTATFSVSATGAAPLSFKWQKKTGANALWEDIQGATSPVYTTSQANISNSGFAYRVRITDALGSTVTSEAAILTVVEAPDTGDHSRPALYVVLTLFFMAAAVLLLRKRRTV